MKHDAETKSAVERLQRSKSRYVKSESVLGTSQIPMFSSQLQVTTRPSLDLCHKRLLSMKRQNKRTSSVVLDDGTKSASTVTLPNCDIVSRGSDETKTNFKSLPNLHDPGSYRSTQTIHQWDTGTKERFAARELSSQREAEKEGRDHADKLSGKASHISSQPNREEFISSSNCAVTRSKSFKIDKRKIAENKRKLWSSEYSGNSTDSSAYFSLRSTAVANHISSIQASSEPSLIEKNARIIKWLHSCQKYVGTYKPV